MSKKIFSLLVVLAMLLNPVILPSYAISNRDIALGNKYAQEGHSAYNSKNFLKAAQSYERAYEITKHKLYLDNAIVAYTSHIFNLTNDKQYDEALKYANKALSLKPDDSGVKEALADIYFSRGVDYFYTGNMDKAKKDLQTSLKYSVSREQTERVKDGLSKIEDAIKNNLIPSPKYNETSNNSVPEILARIETRIYGKTSEKIPIMDRINKLEKETLGKNYDDGIVIRVDRLKKSILPEAAASQTYPVQNLSYSGTYIPEIIEQSMGRVSTFGKMPILVYFDDTPKGYKKFYKDAAIAGFKEWEKASDNRIKFETTDMEQKADIGVKWTEDFEDYPWQPTLKQEDVSAEKERMKYRKASAMVQVGSVLALLAGALVPPVGMVGAIGSSVASPILQYKGTQINKFSPDLKIPVKPTIGMPDETAKIRIKQIAMHQTGHAIGIYGHSSNPDDIMFANFTVNQLSPRDINTIKEIYKPKEIPQKPENK